jgi:hypothetical protein
LFSNSLEVSAQPGRKLSSPTLSDLLAISEAAATALSDDGINTVDDLDSKDESPWTPADVE